MVSKRFVPSENFEQKALVRWLEPLKQAGKLRFAHIPNETPTDAISAKEQQRKGVRRGVPDMLMIVGKKLFFIELKRTVGGVVSKHQQDWIDSMKLCGVDAHVCEGFKAAQAIIHNVMKEQGV